MEWLKKHGDTIVIISSFVWCFWTLNEKINSLEKDMTIVKTVMIMQNMLPKELAVKE